MGVGPGLPSFMPFRLCSRHVFPVFCSSNTTCSQYRSPEWRGVPRKDPRTGRLVQSLWIIQQHLHQVEEQGGFPFVGCHQRQVPGHRLWGQELLQMAEIIPWRKTQTNQWSFQERAETRLPRSGGGVGGLHWVENEEISAGQVGHLVADHEGQGNVVDAYFPTHDMFGK